MDAFQLIGPSILASADALSAKEPTIWGLAAYIVFVLLILFALMVYAKKGLGVRVFKNPVTSLFEQLYLFIENMCVGSIGQHGRKYIPMMMTFWMMIFVGNIVGLLFPFTPTADLSFNLGMALIAVCYVQYEGMQVNGVFGHLRHFAGPKLPGAMVIISGLIFTIEIISELMKNVSLSLRLYGNIHGGHLAVEAMNNLGNKIYLPIGVLVLLLIKLLTCLVQALIFTMLTCVYLSLVTHHEEDSSDGGHGEAAGAH
jgi:F-type H+-transporting ATPase subunit a